MTVQIENEYKGDMPKNWEAIIKEIATGVCDDLACPFEAEVDVLLTDNEAIRLINKEQRGVDSPTDVLSFPLNEYPAGGDFSRLMDEGCFHPDTGELMLGDIVISIDKVFSQAADYGHGSPRELAFLTAHSMLHLFGYDHIDEQERAMMEQMQENILEKRGYVRGV